MMACCLHIQRGVVVLKYVQYNGRDKVTEVWKGLASQLTSSVESLGLIQCMARTCILEVCACAVS